jgi:hypothetical protein
MSPVIERQEPSILSIEKKRECGAQTSHSLLVRNVDAALGV